MPPEFERPGLAWLLEHGTGFTGHHVVTLPCGPSRSTIYTGQHTGHTGVFTNPGANTNPGMSPDVPTVGGMLREHGYYTAYKGKWHVSVIEPPARFTASTVDALEPFGFAEYTSDGDPVGVPWDGYRQDPAIASDAANWLFGRAGTKPADTPWFLAVKLRAPARRHVLRRNRIDGPDPVAAPPGATPAGADRSAVRTGLGRAAAGQLRRRPQVQARFADAADPCHRNDAGPFPRDDEAAWRALRSYYFNCLVDLDRSLQTLLRALVAAGHHRDTVIVYTSDHGEAAGAHGLREKPTSLYRPVVNVPLIVVDPDHEASTTTTALASSIDLAPTLLAFAGVEATERAEHHPALRGHDLRPALGAGGRRTGRDDAGVLFCMDRPPPRAGRDGQAQRLSMQGIFDGRWKFARYFAPGDGRAASLSELTSRNDLELYDTLAEPRRAAQSRARSGIS